MTRLRGICYFWNRSKGFGFIRTLEGERFAAYPDYIQMPMQFQYLHVGWVYEFSPANGPVGPVGVDVTPILVQGVNDKYFTRAQLAYDQEANRNANSTGTD